MPPSRTGIYFDCLAGVVFGDSVFFEPSLFRLGTVFWNPVADIDMSARELDQRFKIVSVEPEYFMQFTDGFFGLELAVESVGVFEQSGDLPAVLPAARLLRLLRRCGLCRINTAGGRHQHGQREEQHEWNVSLQDRLP